MGWRRPNLADPTRFFESSRFLRRNALLLLELRAILGDARLSCWQNLFGGQYGVSSAAFTMILLSQSSNRS